jgi:pyridoxamine 5'-phosphate oxidase
MENPFAKLRDWWQQAITNSPLKQKSAVCISTIDKQGFPAARFVDLKDITSTGLVFCSYLDSAKGAHIDHNNKVALTAWWEHLGKQIRVVGKASRISDRDANQYWQSRSRAAQITTLSCKQSEPIADLDDLHAQVKTNTEKLEHQPNIPRPDNWGGYLVEPISIEFLTFKDDRLHIREVFSLEGSNWQKQLLQP